MRDLVRAAADDAGATDTCTADMVQAVDEAATNAIIHPADDITIMAIGRRARRPRSPGATKRNRAAP